LNQSLAISLSLVLVGCGHDLSTPREDENEAELLANQEQQLVTGAVTSREAFVVFADPYADGTANPAQDVVGKAAVAYTSSNESYVAVRVARLPPNRTFGAHVHKLPCDQSKGGTHYQDVPSPTTPTDPAYANPTNEIWLDFTTDASGVGFVVSKAAFRIRAGEAKSIVLHTNPTASGGIAGAKLACVNLNF
jgi:superoxide dismutase, Cu-Zn family